MHTQFTPGHVLPHLRRAAASLCLTAFCLFVAPQQGTAAPMADDHTVIYYLLEVQRQYTKTCNGVRMADSPSLIPSESVRTLAEMAALSGQSLPVLLQSHGLAGSQAFYGTASGDTPKDVVTRLVAQDCPSLMGQNFRYIGATQNNGIWSVMMTEREPVFSSTPGYMPQQFPGDASAGAANGPAINDGTAGTAPAQATPDRSGIVQLEAENQPQPALVLQGMPGADVAPTESGARPGPGTMPDNDPYAPAPPQITAVYGPDAHLVLPSGTAGTAASGAPQTAGAAAGTAGPVSRGAAIAHPGTLQSTPGPVVGQTAPVNVAAPHGSAPPAEALLSLVNQTRARGYQCGGIVMPPAPPLVMTPSLQAAAAAHAADMAAKNYFSSTTPAGISLGQRLTAAGYVWVKVGEAIAAVQPPANMALETWLYQESQCKLLLSPEYTEAGAAFEPGRNYWVFTLARPMEMEEGGIRLE